MKSFWFIAGSLKKSAAFAAVGLLLVGCGGGVVAPFPYDRMAPVAPPEPIVETKQVAEDPSIQLWRSGYWDYDGFSFTWVPGELIQRPDLSAAWSADRWEMRGYGWVFIPGYWQ